MSRRPSAAGRGSADLVTAVPLPRLPVARAAGNYRLYRAVAFAAFLALCAALWSAFPSLVSWLLTHRIHDQSIVQLMIGSAHHDSAFQIALRTVLFVSLFGAAGFVWSYRMSAPARPVAALENSAC